MGPKLYDLTGKRIWVAGHCGMVGSAVVRALARRNADCIAAERRIDLRDFVATESFMAKARPQIVILAAAKVGGIAAHESHAAEFLHDNLMIGANVIEAARRTGAEKLIYLASSSVYPRSAPQPIAETALLTGPPEPSHEGYALAKIACIKMCAAYRRQYGSDFISVIPTNLYGPNDNFDPASSHVLAALLRRIDEAAQNCADEVTIWGSGTPRREFLHVDDMAGAILFLLEHYSGAEPLNVGYGEDVGIGELARMIAGVTGFKGRFVFDASRPDGAPRKLLDCSRLNALGWSPRIALQDGLQSTYEWYRANRANLRGGNA